MARGSFGMKLFLGVVKAIVRTNKANTPKASKPTTSRVSQRT